MLPAPSRSFADLGDHLSFFSLRFSSSAFRIISHANDFIRDDYAISSKAIRSQANLYLDSFSCFRREELDMNLSFNLLIQACGDVNLNKYDLNSILCSALYHYLLLGHEFANLILLNLYNLSADCGADGALNDLSGT